MMEKKIKITEDVLDVLKDCKFESNKIQLPEIQLDRNLYDDVNKVLVAIGYKWDKKSKCHISEYDVLEQFQNALKNKEVIDWKKSTDFFFTPDILVNEMLGLVTQYRLNEFTMLEPSAGQGHILDLFSYNFPNAKINCVDINPNHCEFLKKKGYSPICSNFLDVEPFPVDVIIMNPPFTYEIEHIKHAFEFLKIGGQLLTITSTAILSGKNSKYKEFKKWFEDNWGYDYPIENLNYSFKDSGTNVKVKLLSMEKYEELYG